MNIAQAIIVVLLVAFNVSLGLSTLSTIYMVYIYRRSSRPRSWFFRMMVNGSVIKSLSGAYLGYETATYLAQQFGLALPRVPTEINAPALLAVAIVLVTPPTYYAWTILQVRRRGIYDPEFVLAERTTTSPTHQAEVEQGASDTWMDEDGNVRKPSSP